MLSPCLNNYKKFTSLGSGGSHRRQSLFKVFTHNLEAKVKILKSNILK